VNKTAPVPISFYALKLSPAAANEVLPGQPRPSANLTVAAKRIKYNIVKRIQYC
jgi:hypothetical protein